MKAKESLKRFVRRNFPKHENDLSMGSSIFGRAEYKAETLSSMLAPEDFGKQVFSDEAVGIIHRLTDERCEVIWMRLKELKRAC